MAKIMNVFSFSIIFGLSLLLLPMQGYGGESTIKPRAIENFSGTGVKIDRLKVEDDFFLEIYCHKSSGEFKSQSEGFIDGLLGKVPGASTLISLLKVNPLGKNDFRCWVSKRKNENGVAVTSRTVKIIARTFAGKQLHKTVSHKCYFWFKCIKTAYAQGINPGSMVACIEGVKRGNRGFRSVILALGKYPDEYKSKINVVKDMACNKRGF